MKKTKSGERPFNIIVVILLILTGIVTIYPLWFVVIASVSDPQSIALGKVVFLPSGFNLQAYQKLFETEIIWIGYKNSLIYVSLNCILSLTVMLPCAYALSRKTLPGKTFFSTIFIITMYFGGGLIPTYMVLNRLGFVNNPAALIVPSCVAVYEMILLKNFFTNNVPDALWDAARIDGSSYTRFFLKIVMPLSKSITSVIALFIITTHWNAYLAAQMYLYDKKLYTLQQVIKMITSTIDTGLMEDATSDQISAALLEKNLMKYSIVIVGCLPLLILYPFIQKFIVDGILVGAVKE